MTFSRHEFTPAELSGMVTAERAGSAFVAVRDADGALRFVELTGERVCVGRNAGNDLVLRWDTEVSRLHALFERLADTWTVVDDGLSRNGTFVNGVRVRGRRRLSDRDVLRFGVTEVLYRDPAAEAAETPRVSRETGVASITPAQLRVLAALCRPLMEADEPGATPPSNSELADSLGVSTEAVRSHLKTLFRLFEIPDLPQNRKRAELARRALTAGVVAPRDVR